MGVRRHVAVVDLVRAIEDVRDRGCLRPWSCAGRPERSRFASLAYPSSCVRAIVTAGA